MNTYSQSFHDHIYLIEQQIPVNRGDNWLKIHQKSKYVNDKWQRKVEFAGFGQG